ncbi:hypothetical protein TTHERM_01178710 (macronuclear) [Tetrahymena thermophila SB210]|uniref:EGF-like domain-containing protein n=1 Tax=Tetrahymena thermophila (strain SB210) TaxID=312017 RepID=Q22KY4_TETTS|nr:hypothetical protein TTHERM_01178710 [Tetrahymena thermophila SB210]EAR85944.2 hypothetical protein TTHERM_01178710 [Tetrahymena thermophila SB210]|eukprot:XP_976539.2 hypothetical protein TTHERM_01178710 [Tetrahymena thermophila SB210]
MVTKIGLKLFVIFIYYIQGAYQYQKLLSKYYDTTTNCSNELKSNWDIIGGGSFPSNQCQISCSLSSYTYTSFYLSPFIYLSGFEITKNITQPASIIGYDLVFYVSGQFSVSIQGDNQILNTKVLQQQIYGTFPQEILYVGVNCQGATFQSIFTSSYVSGQSFTTFKLQFTNLPPNYGFFKIIMWANCVLNCDQCQDSSNCSICLQGFTLMVMPSGQKVCSQQEGCSKSNCLECAKSGIIEVCINCQPGYSLDNSNTCVSNGNACSSGQYQNTDKTCKSYSSSCQMQSPGSTTWVSCHQVPDQTAIKCYNNKLILLYERGNYNTRVCGCNNFAYCDQCTLSSCTKCITGYTLNGQSCSFSSCPQGYYLNQLTNLCNPQQCKDTQCQKCDQYICYQCASANYYVDGSNPAYCKQCLVNNCQQCNPDGTCKICNSGYYFSSGSCLSCIKNCMVCTNSQTCQNCISNYTLNSDKKSCICSINNCLQCSPSDGSVCQICSNGSFDSTSKTCKCSVQNCSLCNQNTNSSCQQCVGLYVKDNNNLCQCPIKNCSVCSQNGDQCLNCTQGYQLSSGNTKCNCSVLNCLQCSQTDGTICQICQNGSFDLISKTCICSVQNCSLCNQNDKSTCQKCVGSYVKDINGQCQCPIKNCSVCTANGDQCVTCIQGYQLSNGNTQCNCSIQNCLQCSQIDGSICQICQNGSFDLVSKTCKCTVQNCLLCNQNTNSSCQQCANSFVKDNNNQCQCSIKNCSQCNQTGNLCLACTQGYFLSNGNTQCNCSVENCLQCSQTDGSICQNCQNGQFDPTTKTCQCLVSNCMLCTQNANSRCQQCLGLYFKDINNQCQCPIKNCAACNTIGDKCLTCVQGYQLINGNTECNCSVQNCLQCSQTDGSICQDCQNGSFDPSTKACQCLVENCSLCDQNTNSSCKKCSGLYVKDNNNQCKCSIQNCSRCNQNGDQCIDCIQGYQLSSGNTQCNCSVQNCLQCSQIDGTICQVCQNGSFNIITKSCQCQVQNCSQCEQNDDHSCKQCMGLYVKDNNNQCQCPIANCNQCNQNGDQCLTCINGYQLNNSKTQCNCSVQNCIQCSQYDGNQCQQCQNGFINQGSQCQKQAQNCEIEDPTDGLKCLQCKNGYINTSSLCKCSVPNCKNCNTNDGSICDNCQDGFLLNDNKKQCLCEVNSQQCQTPSKCEVQMCKQCKENSQEKCQICQDTYTLTSDFFCVLELQNDFSVFQTVTQNIGYNVTIAFSQQIIFSQQDVQNLLNLQIEDFENPFVVNILSIKEQQIQVQLQLKDNCKNKKLIVQLNNIQFLHINNLKDSQKEVKLKEYIILSQNQVAQAQKTGEVAQGAANTLLITMILMIIIGNTYVLFSTIDLTTFIYFLLFVDIRHPQNLINFCSIFQNFQFAFVPNTIQVYFIEPNYVQPKTPQKFLENGYDAYFLNGAGQSCTIIAGIVTIYGIIKVLSYIPIPKIKIYIESKIKSGWEYSGFLDLIGCVYVYVLVSSLCQFYCFQFDEPLAFINYTLFAISFIFVFLAPITMVIFITKCKNLSDPQIQQQFGSLIGGLVVPNQQNNPENNLIKEHQNKVAAEPDIINFNKNNKNENSTIPKQQFLQLKWKKSGNFKNGVSEIILIMMQTSVCFLVEDSDNQDEQQRYNIGWVIIACASTILTIHIFSVVVDLIGVQSINNIFTQVGFIISSQKP